MKSHFSCLGLIAAVSLLGSACDYSVSGAKRPALAGKPVDVSSSVSQAGEGAAQGDQGEDIAPSIAEEEATTVEEETTPATPPVVTPLPPPTIPTPPVIQPNPNPPPSQPVHPGPVIVHPDLPVLDVDAVRPLSPADVDAIDNLKISLMVPNFSGAEAKHVGLIFCPTSDFYGADCIKTRLETSVTSYIHRAGVSSFYLLQEGNVNASSVAVIDEGRMGELHLSRFKYFRFYALGTGDQDSLLIGGVELLAKPKGTSDWVSVYRNPCVNRMVVSTDGDIWGPGYARTSDHSLTDDQAVCVYLKTAAWKDADTDDTISIEVPLSQPLEVAAKRWILGNNNDDANNMALHYDEGGQKISAELKWDNYEDYSAGHETSYGFTVFKSKGSLHPAYRLKTNGDDAFGFAKLEVYEFNPGDAAYLVKSRVQGKVYEENEHLGSLSKDGDEGTSAWPLQYDLLSEMTSRQFEIMAWNTTATAFGLK